VSIKAPYGTQTLAVSAAFVGHRAGFMTICHELCHVLGTGHDLYGASGLNQNCTLMDATAGTPDDPETYHLDPWHKLQYGWSEPRIRTLDSFGPIELPAANMGDPEAPVIIYDPKHGTNEYFILEYRSSLNPAGSMYDKNVNSNGLAIWHVITDQNKSPMEIPSLAVVKRRAEQTLAGTDKSVFLDGAPDLARGGNTLWVGDQVTPPLRWLDKAETDPEPEFPELRWDGDGSPTGTRIKVWPFHPTDASITVELILNVVDEFHGSQEASTHVSDVQTMGKFHGIQDHPAGSRSGKGIGEN
jgi:hypothetical protein